MCSSSLGAWMGRSYIKWVWTKERCTCSGPVMASDSVSSVPHLQVPRKPEENWRDSGSKVSSLVQGSPLSAGMALPMERGETACGSEFSSLQGLLPAVGGLSLQMHPADNDYSIVPLFWISFTLLLDLKPGLEFWSPAERTKGTNIRIKQKAIQCVKSWVGEPHVLSWKHAPVTPNPVCGGWLEAVTSWAGSWRIKRSYSREGLWVQMCRIKAFQAEGTVLSNLGDSGNQWLSCAFFIFQLVKCIPNLSDRVSRKNCLLMHSVTQWIFIECPQCTRQTALRDS